MIIYSTDYGKAHNGDCLKIIKQLDSNSIDTLITDPPAGINFMGKEWDHHKGGRQKWIDYMTERFSEAFRVIKPGGLAIVWALPRTSHWTAIALEDAGWYIDTKIYFLFGAGWPKSLDLSKGIDKHFGCEREKVENKGHVHQGTKDGHNYGMRTGDATIEPTPVHQQAKKWDGYKTQLKPMCEEWIVCRKPVDKNFVNNALVYGVAGYNIDGCRIEMDLDIERRYDLEHHTQDVSKTYKNQVFPGSNQMVKTFAKSMQETFKKGRYPGNVIIDNEVAEDMDKRTGFIQVGGNMYAAKRKKRNNGIFQSFGKQDEFIRDMGGGASRYFKHCNHQEIDYLYGSKATGSEKHTDIKNIHPTVKSIELMRHLCKLSKPPGGGIVLDIFAGTFSTAIAAYLENREFIVIEEKKEYCEIGLSRLKAALEQRKFKW